LDRNTDVGAVRRQVEDALTDLGGDHLCDVLLVVSELVRNVLDHTAGPGRLRLARARNPCQVVVEVDDSSSLDPVRGASRLGESRGRGIMMVEDMAHRWGTKPRPGGKTVFALLRCGGVRMAANACDVTTR